MHLGLLKKHSRLVAFAFRLFDFLLIVLSGAVLFFHSLDRNFLSPDFYFAAMVLGGVLGLLIFQCSRVYVSFRGRKLSQHFKSLVLAWIFLTLSLSFLAFFTKTGAHFSRVWLFEWMLLGFVLSCFSRLVLVGFLRFFRAKGFNIRRVVVVGSGKLAQRVCHRLQQDKSMGYEVLAFLDREEIVERRSKEIEGISIESIPKNLEAWLQSHISDEIWIAVPLHDLVFLKELMHEFRFSTATIRIIPDIFELDVLNYSMSEIGGMPVLNLRSTPLQGGHCVIKTAEDIAISSLILLCISPILLAIAVAVKLSSPGPVFYRQERVSLNNKAFNMLKFRSMPMDAESQVGAVWAKPGEGRATKVGTFLRKTSLDELPQFINVLKGDMSIVGPRPERPVFVEQFKQEIPGYMQKHMVKAGITGWAQINGWRGRTDLKKRVEYDLYYIENWSLWFDLKIIFLTIFKGFLNKNAY